MTRRSSPNASCAHQGQTAKLFSLALSTGQYGSKTATHPGRRRTPNTPTAYVTYRATQHAIAQITGADIVTQTQHLHIFQLNPTAAAPVRKTDPNVA
ncbi:MAG: hypothetical protein R2856_01545 [Caldilineaceae bacterium]